MKVGFIFPNGTVARFTAAKLLETGYEVAFYCPEKSDLDIAKGIIFELNIIAKEVNQTRDIEKSFHVMTNNDMRDCNIIGKASFLNLGVGLNDFPFFELLNILLNRFLIFLIESIF